MKIELPGQPARVDEDTHGFGEFAKILNPTVRGATDVKAARRARATEARVSTDGPDDDVLELRWEDGIVELVRAGDIERHHPDTKRDATGALSIPTRKTISGTVRGEQEINLEGVTRIGVAITKKATGYLFPKAVKEIEHALMPDPGLYKLRRDGSFEQRDRVDQKLKGKGEPILVLLHGTFSSTQGSFSELFESSDWKRLTTRYPDRIFSLEQHTVTASPALNAIELARYIPSGAKVHLLSHSRGGLVGDLLCRYPWDTQDVDRLFRQKQYAQVVDELRRLGRLCGHFEVERFARVAAPAAGTLLASERLDRYLNVILTLIGKLLGPGDAWFKFVKAITTAIVSTRTEADKLPGIEAMMPHVDKGFVPFLNIAEPRGSDLAVIAGDIEGGGLFDRVKGFFADLYYREDNDFVVDSKSMFRGMPRQRSRGFYYRAPRATHFSYFQEMETRARMVDWLVDGDESGFVTLNAAEPYGGLRAREALRTIAPLPDRADLPTVYMLPGIMGSHLAVSSERYWIDPVNLAWNGLEGLGISEPAVEPEALVDMVYEKLFRRLEAHYNVRPFAYDWRLSIRASAARLAAELRRELDEHDRPIRLMAHSMGGLVARAFIMDHPDLWQQMVQRGGRLVMMGTPNHGSYVPAQVLTQQHKLMKRLALVALWHDLDDLTQVVKLFPGLIEMLPAKGNMDLLSPTAWTGLGSAAPHKLVLQRARAFRDALAKAPAHPEHMVYVAGHDKDTPAAMEVSNGKVRFLYTGLGDGTVPWSLGLLDDVDTYYVDAEHGQIPNHEESFDAFVDLLATGKTKLLSDVPPVSVREAEAKLREPQDVEKERDERLRYYPSPDDLTALIMGRPRELEPTSEPPLQMSVVNADVREARYPVLVGHYEGDPIVSAEAVLDRALGNVMSRDHRLDRYVGPVGSVRIYRANGNPAGAVVTGLGPVGELTATRLEECLEQAMLEVALGSLAKLGAEPTRVYLSSVLIGTFGGARICVEDSVRALAQAAWAANTKLRKEGLGGRAYIAGIEVVELFQDVAIEAAHAALRIGDGSERYVSAEPFLLTGTGARRMRPRSPYKSGWQRRLRITVDEKRDVIEYEVTTDMARVEPHERPIQWGHVDGPLKQALNANRDAPSTLFRYLLPYQLFDAADDSPDLVLQVDPTAARIPWELLDPVNDEKPPVAVRVGVVRNFTSINRRQDPVRSRGRGALVIGEPAGVKPELVGAREEARHVAEYLKARRLNVTAKIQRDADECFKALYDGEYDIIHIAAHGSYDAKKPKNTGVVLANDRFLSAAVFENLRAVPSIVFLNCCHLGKISGDATDGSARPPLEDPGRLAASVAVQLIEMGVRVVVVAGWAVGDAAAKEFAATLYRELLDGRNLVAAVCEARARTFKACGANDLTWGAYQVYGDPGFELPYAELGRDGRHVTPRFVAPTEVVDYVTDFGSRSRNPDPQLRAAELEAELEDIAANIPAAWRQRGDVLEAIAQAFADLANYERAVHWYRLAVATSGASLRAVEQLASAESRVAVQRHRADPDDPEIEQLLEASSKRLQSLLDIETSSERLALKGATLKRMVDCVKAKAKKNELRQQALQSYARAAELEPPDLYYPLINKVQLQLALGQQPTDADLQAIEKNVASRNGDVWARTTGAEVKLIRYALGGPGTETDALQAYRSALDGGAGLVKRERDSVLESMQRLIDAMPKGPIRTRLESVKRAADRRAQSGADRHPGGLPIDSGQPVIQPAALPR